MSHPLRRSRLHALVVEGDYGGNIVDLGVQEYEKRCFGDGFSIKFVFGGSYPYNGNGGFIT